MKRIFVIGQGAVSPAGWGVAALRDALARDQPLPVQWLERPGSQQRYRARLVPDPPERPAFLAHPRLRRSSPITHYAAAAALEALAGLPAQPDRRLGLIVCLQSGCVQYSHRFFAEVLADPATASPLVFPETIFAAPASHIAVLLGNAPQVATLIGDAGTFLQGLALGAAWLEANLVDFCVVLGAEEVNWLRADALWHLEHAGITSGGAGALCLGAEPTAGSAVELSAVTEAQTYSTRLPRAAAARSMREKLGPARPGELLCDGISDSPRTDRAEQATWSDWSGSRLSPKRILGEGLMAAPAWQSVAACDLLSAGRFPSAAVSVVGSNQQAVAARFVRAA